MQLFSPQAFAGFGPDPLNLCGGAPRLFQIHGRRSSALRSLVRLDAPRRPGVYGMLDERGEVIYVGKARCLRTRLLSYFRPKSRQPKAGHIIGQTRRLAWEVLPTELSALLREMELIRRWQPRFNVAGQPRRKRPAWICLGRRPAQHVFVSLRVPSTAVAAFGPVPGGVRAREAVRRLNDLYRLRDCPQPQTMTFADQRDLFPVPLAAGCLRLEIGTCLGPCAAACSQQEYSVQVRAARGFLDGSDLSALVQLDREMQQASGAMEFERAAALRDRLGVLGWLHEHLERLRQARRLSLVYPLQGHDGRDWWYVIVRGDVRGVVAVDDPQRLRGLLAEGQHGAEQVDNVLLLAAWFRKRPEELRRGISLEECRSRLSAVDR